MLYEELSPGDVCIWSGDEPYLLISRDVDFKKATWLRSSCTQLFIEIGYGLQSPIPRDVIVLKHRKVNKT